MARDVRFIIAANAQRAEQEIRNLQRTGTDAAHILEREFQQLGTSSSTAFDRKRQAAQSSYERIRTSGMATKDELERAEKALGDRLTSIDQEQFGRRTSLMDKFKANWLSATAALGAGYLAVSQGWNMAKEAAEAMQQRQAFANLAASHGQSADRIIANLRRTSAETISTKDLIEKAGTSILLGIPVDKLESLMEIARASSRVTGQTITKSFEDISLAVGRQSRMILDNLGIIVSEEKANKDYARSLGKTAEQLTDSEKKQAFMNATLEAGAEIIKRVGVAGQTSAEKMQQFEARLKNLRETVGVGLLAALNVVHAVITGTAAASLHLAGGLMRVAEGTMFLTGNREKFEEYRLSADAAFAAASDLAGKGMASVGMAADLVTGKMAAVSATTMQMAQVNRDAAAQLQQAADKEKARVSDGLKHWGDYLKNLQTMHDAAVESIKTKRRELFDMRANTGDLIAKAQQELMTPVEKYYDSVRRLDEKQTRAMTMSGDEKLKVLTEVQQAWSGLTGEVANGEQIMVTQVQAVGLAVQRMGSIGVEMEAEKARQIAAAESQLRSIDDALRLAQERVDSYSKTLVALGAKIEEINKDITFRVNDLATPVIRQIKSELESLRGSGVTISASMAAGYGLAAGPEIPAYALGTPYVPRTGLALIHQGERIVPAAANARGEYGTTVNLQGGITVNVSGSGSTPLSGADIARQIFPELQRLAKQQRAA